MQCSDGAELFIGGERCDHDDDGIRHGTVAGAEQGVQQGDVQDRDLVEING